MSGMTLDAGALIAFDRGSGRMRALVRRADQGGHHLTVPAGVVAQTWRDASRQVWLARLLDAPVTVVEPLDDGTARAVGVLCGRSRAADVVDVSVVLCARRHRQPVVSADGDHLRAIDPRLTVVAP